MAGRLLGIARKAYKFAPMETLNEAQITAAGGLVGDYRGVLNPAKANRRQVTIFTREDWELALREIGAEANWADRRCNLFVEGMVLPRDSGVVVRIGESATLEITGECDPCKRMEAVAIGLFPALRPDWRGGRLMRVTAPGAIRVGDEVRIEA